MNEENKTYAGFEEAIMKEAKEKNIKPYLFIGGIKDGEWHNVPEGSRKWAFPWIKFQPLKSEQDFGWQEHGEITYIKVCMDSNPETKLYVFVEESMYTNNTKWYWDIICKLVNNYKVIK